MILERQFHFVTKKIDVIKYTVFLKYLYYYKEE